MKFKVRFYYHGYPIYEDKVYIEAEDKEQARKILKLMLESDDINLPKDVYDFCEV